MAVCGYPLPPKSPCAVGEDQNPKSDKVERAYLDTVVSEAYPSVSLSQMNQSIPLSP